MIDYAPLYLAFLAVFLLGIAELRLAYRDRYLIAILAIAILVIVQALREPGFGSDDLGYLNIFQAVSNEFEISKDWFGYNYQSINIEFGYFLILAALSQIGVLSLVMFGANGVMSLGFLYRASSRFSPHFIPFLLVYMSHHFLSKDLNALRLALASSIVAYGMSFLVKQRFLQSFFWVALASCFHVTALIGVVPVIVSRLNLRQSTLLVGASGLIIVNVLYPFTNILYAIPLFEFLQYKFDLYANAESYNFSLGFFDPVNIKNIGLVVLGYITLSRISRFDSQFRVSLLVFLCGSLFRILFSEIAIVGGRGWAILSVFECWIISILSAHYFGRIRGYLAVAGYAFAVMSLNLYGNTQWRGEAGFFG